jgi:hypothetical protein
MVSVAARWAPQVLRFEQGHPRHSSPGEAGNLREFP